jgi:hypothetical protein
MDCSKEKKSSKKEMKMHINISYIMKKKDQVEEKKI